MQPADLKQQSAMANPSVPSSSRTDERPTSSSTESSVAGSPDTPESKSAGMVIGAGVKVTMTVVLCPILQDRFMHAADVFEPFKRLIEEPLTLVGESEGRRTLTEVLTQLKDAMESTAKYEVLAVFHPYIAEGAWCNQDVIMVSTGHQFCKFADYLAMLHYRGPEPKRYLDEKITAADTAGDPSRIKMADQALRVTT